MTGPLVRASAIVLAGGRSSRFGSDKLRATTSGRTILEHAVDAVARVCDEVVVVAAAGGPLPELEGVRLVRDPAPYPGPLAAFVEGARHALGGQVLVVGGDMPFLAPGVLRLLLGALGFRTCAIVLDAAQPLPMALDRASALMAGADILGGGERSLRALALALGASILPAAVWRPIDPDGLTLRDIDRPADLRRT